MAGKPDLGSVAASIVDPLLSDNYELNFPSIPGTGSPEPLRLQCRTATKPGMTINAVEAQLFGHTLEYAGQLTYGHDMSVEYIENRMVQITTILEAWAEIARKHDTQHGAYKKDYAVTGYLKLFDQVGNIVKEYSIVNCWPSAVPDMSLDGQSSTLITVAATFKYDYYETRR